MSLTTNNIGRNGTMSYSFDMYFAKADSLQEALFLANKFVGTICTLPRMKETIKENALFLPSVKYVGKPDERKFSALADKYFLYSLFNFRFVYWKKHKLLGMQDMQNFRDDWKKVSGLKEVSWVLFQSSCSQNMSLQEWPREIPYFKKVCREYERMLSKNPMVTIQTLQKRGEYICDDTEGLAIGLTRQNIFTKLFSKQNQAIQERDKTFEYIVLSALYTHIFEELDLGAWLYGNDSPVFERFSINGIHTTEDVFDLDARTRICVNDICDNIDSKKSEIVPVYLEDNKTILKMFKYVHLRKETDSNPQAIVEKAVRKFMETEEWKKFSIAAGITEKGPTCNQVLSAVPDYWFRRYGLYPLRKDQYTDPVYLQ